MAGTAKERFDLFRSQIDNFPGKSKIPLARGGWASWPPGPQQKLGGAGNLSARMGRTTSGAMPEWPLLPVHIHFQPAGGGGEAVECCLFAQGRGARVKDGSGWKALVAPRGEVQRRMLVAFSQASRLAAISAQAALTAVSASPRNSEAASWPG